MDWEVLDRIKRHFGALTPRQRKVAEFLVQDLQRLAFSSAATIAREATVSETTVVRLAKSMGYEGFAEMQESVRRQSNLRLEEFGLARRSTLIEDFKQKEDILTAVARRHQENIHSTVADIPASTFQAIARTIAQADVVYVAGHHWSRSLGLMLVDLLRSVTFNAHVFGGQEEQEWQLATLTEGSVVIGIGFPRYATDTIKLLRSARERGARIIAITDTITSPLAMEAEGVLPISGSSTLPGSDYFAGAVTVLYSLHVAVSMGGGHADDPRIRSLQQAYRQLRTFDPEEA